MIYNIFYKIVEKEGVEYAKITKTTVSAPSVELVEFKLTKLFSSEILSQYKLYY